MYIWVLYTLDVYTNVPHRYVENYCSLYMPYICTRHFGVHFMPMYRAVHWVTYVPRIASQRIPQWRKNTSRLADNRHKPADVINMQMSGLHCFAAEDYQSLTSGKKNARTHTHAHTNTYTHTHTDWVRTDNKTWATLLSLHQNQFHLSKCKSASHMTKARRSETYTAHAVRICAPEPDVSVRHIFRLMTSLIELAVVLGTARMLNKDRSGTAAMQFSTTMSTFDFVI